MDSIFELLKSVPLVGWIIGAVVTVIGVKLVSKKGIGGSLGGVSLDGILGNLRNNRKRTERAIDNNRVATESVDNAEERIKESKRVVADAEDNIVRAEERVDDSQGVNDAAISTADSISAGLGDSEDELDRAKSIIDRVRSRNSTN